MSKLSKKQKKNIYKYLDKIYKTKKKEIDLLINMHICLEFIKKKNKYIKNLNKYKEIIKLFCECKILQKSYIKSSTNLESLFNFFKVNVNNKIIKYNDNSIYNLNLKLAYLKKHNELNLIYQSYKEILYKMIKYRKILIRFYQLPKMKISPLNLEKMIKQQNEIMQSISSFNKFLN